VRDDLPTGTVTFLFTDVEGSTQLLHELGAEAYADALAEHRRIVREACAAHGGVEVDTQGDAFFFAFPTAPGGIVAAWEAMEALGSGPIHVRMGLHTGMPLLTEEGYVGEDVHFAARVAATSHGGQVVLSRVTRDLLDEGYTLTELGEHRLKDIEAPIPIFQLGSETFPPLKTISNTNLPRPVSSFVGREAELAHVLGRIEQGARLLTLTGPGGSGKTRLAIEAATTLVPSYKAGVFWVSLASLREPSLVPDNIAQTLGARDGLAEHVGEREMLLLLDNLEQVVEAAPELSTLLTTCPNLTLLCTSRELLRVQGEVEYPVPPLASPEAVSLFGERSGLEPSDAIAELCVRLDNLPLAVELAAARAKALSPRQILERLSQRLDLLEGGRDVDARQQTLRATIEWSHDLLSAGEKRLFRSLSVFAGGCTLDAAEEICGADIQTLQPLVEKSLLRFSPLDAGSRYWLLETVHEYTRERLDEAGETKGLARRHADYYLTRLEQNDPVLRGPDTGRLLAWYAAEEDNLRVILDRLAELAPDDAARAAYLLSPYWIARSALGEGRERLQTLLAIGHLDGVSRASLLERLSDIEERLGNLDAAQAAAEEAVTLATATDARPVLVDALLGLAWIADRREEFDDAVRLGSRALEEATPLDEARRLRCKCDLGSFLRSAGRDDEARAILRESAEAYRLRGDAANEAIALANLGGIDLSAGDYESAYSAYTLAAERSRQLDDQFTAPLANLGPGLGQALLGLGRRDEARAVFARDLARAVSDDMTLDTAMKPFLGLVLSGIALASRPKAYPQAARIRAAVVKLRHEGEFLHHEQFWNGLEQPLIDALGQEAWEEQQAIGAAMTLDQTIALARSLATS
jgi:predicted ATPase/class 3 adenylate cyclase